MRAFLFSLFFGADEIATNLFNLMTIRKAAVKQHADNQKLQQQLWDGQGELGDLKTSYVATKRVLESAYALDLV